MADGDQKNIGVRSIPPAQAAARAHDLAFAIEALCDGFVGELDDEVDQGIIVVTGLQLAVASVVINRLVENLDVEKWTQAFAASVLDAVLHLQRQMARAGKQRVDH